MELGNMFDKLKANDGLYREVSLYRLSYLIYHGLLPIKVETFDEKNDWGCKHYFYFDYSEKLGQLLQLYKGSEFDKYNSVVHHVFMNANSGTPETVMSNIDFLSTKNL